MLLWGVVCRILRENELNSFWNKTVTYQNMEGSWRRGASLLLLQKAATPVLWLWTGWQGSGGRPTLAGPTTWSSPFQTSARYLMTRCMLPLGPAPLRAHQHHLAEVNLGTNLLHERVHLSFPVALLEHGFGLLPSPTCSQGPHQGAVALPCSWLLPLQKRSFVVVVVQFNAAQSPWSAQIPLLLHVANWDFKLAVVCGDYLLVGPGLKLPRRSWLIHSRIEGPISRSSLEKSFPRLFISFSDADGLLWWLPFPFLKIKDLKEL